MAPLNPQAAEYFPHHHHKKLISLPRYPTFHHYRTFRLSPTHQHFVYYPAPDTTYTAALPFSYQTQKRQLIATYNVLPCEPEPVHFSLEQQQQQQQKEEFVADDDKGFLQKQVFKVRRSRMEQQRYVWRAKGSAQQRKPWRAEIESSPQSYNDQYFMAFATKKRCPLTPVRPDGDETTVMIKNIPSKYTRDMLVKFLDDHCFVENARCKENGDANMFAFDCVYLPIDFRTGFNKGYAFVNFTVSEAAWKFSQTASKAKWDLFQSHKIREVVAARLQGKENLEKHFGSMCFPCQSEDVLPVFFSPPRDGVLKGEKRTVGRLVKH